MGVSPTEPFDAARQALRAALAQPGGVCVLTGAGMSAESGVPTFRDALTGHWARFDPMELASEPGFRADPQRVWDWYGERREGVRRARPNAGHLALAAFAERHPGQVTVVTQNVDDLHQRAGSVDAIRLHGDLFDERWLEPCPRAARGANVCDPEWAAPGRPPRCAECGNPLRPGVVWFGEMLPAGAMRAADQAAARCAAMVVVGTSGAVWPAAGLAATARRAGATVIIVNPEPSAIDAEARLLLRATAALGLPALLDTL